MNDETEVQEPFEDTETPKLPVGRPRSNLVKVRVTKFGEGKVSTGKRDELGDVYAKRGEVLRVSPDIAEQLEARALAEMD